MKKPNKEKLKSEVKSVPYSDDDVAEDRAKLELEREISEAMLAARERADLIGMRKSWSEWTLFVIVSVTVFDMALILLIGTESLKFDNNLQITFFIGESLIKVLGLAFLIVNFLFNHKSLGNK